MKLQYGSAVFLFFGIIRCTRLPCISLCGHTCCICAQTRRCTYTNNHSPAYLLSHMHNYISQMKGLCLVCCAGSLSYCQRTKCILSAPLAISVQQPQTYHNNHHPISRPTGCFPPASLLYDVLSAVLIKNQCPHLSGPA